MPDGAPAGAVTSAHGPTAVLSPSARLRAPAARALGRLRGRAALITAWSVITTVLLAALLAPVISPADPLAQSADTLLAPGSADHLLGTDNLGRDQLSRLLHGARPLLLVSAGSVLAGMVVGTAIGVVAGVRGGWVEAILMRLMDALLSFPLMLLGILMIASLGTGATNLTLAVAIALIPLFARLVHGLALRESDRDYVLAARAAGFRQRRIMLLEVLPNLAGPVVVQATSLFSMAAGFATALSYLGLGIQAPTPDWGLMVQEGQPYISRAADLAVIPGVVITMLLVAVTFVGDDLRDVLDPGHRLDRTQAGR